MKRSALYYALIRLASATLRLYFQYWPTANGKMLLWDRVVRRRIIWRSLPIVARTKFNLSLRGSFPDVIHGYLYFFGVWEPGISRLIARHLQAGDTAIDIGANVGAHTMLAASIVGPKGKVYAVEASPRTFKQLKDNLEYNGLRQVVAINVTVSDRPGTVTVFLQGGWNPGSTTVVPQLVDRDNLVGEVQVEAKPLADIVPPDVIRSARLIKIDVEGAEWPILQGMKELLCSLHSECLVLVEANANALAQFGVGLSDVLSLFRSAGWEAFEIANRYDRGFYIRPPRSILSTAIRMDSSVIDLGFCHAPVLRELLASEGIS